MLVTADFYENYYFVLQDAAQGFHWNNSQATLHPFVANYADAGKMCQISCVVVSDCLHHDITAVYFFENIHSSIEEGASSKIPTSQNYIFF